MTVSRLFHPIQINGLQLRNRVVLPAHGPRIGGDRYLRYLEERVKEVALMICSQPVAGGIGAFSPGPPATLPALLAGDSDARLPNPSTPEGSAFFDDLHLPLMRQEADLAHRYGAFCFGQIVHTGSYSFAPDWQVGISPSGVPDEMIGEIPHVLTKTEIKDVIETFANGASRVKRAGMDGLEVHACHGLLLNAFLSPITNKRMDEYGGSLENRARLLHEVVEACRARVGREFVLGVRIAGEDGIPGGLTPDDVVATLSLFKADLDYVSVSASSESGRKGGVTVPTVMSADFPRATFEKAASRIRAGTGLPVILSGRIVDPATAERVLEEGSADLVGLVRAMLADPQWVSKTREGNLDDIRLCTGNNECRSRTQFRVRGLTAPLACAVNAQAGREAEFDAAPPARPQRVMVVGGGPGGMEAARVAALRGHSVVLYERDSVLGGSAMVAACDPRSAGLGEAARHLARQVEKLDAIEVRLGTNVRRADVEAVGPDAVIIATGALPPEMPFGSGSFLQMAAVLRGEQQVRGTVCITTGINGHRAPLSLAATLAERGGRVVLLTERAMVGEDLDPGTNHFLLKQLLELGVELHILTAFEALEGGSVSVRNTLTGKLAQIEKVDSVVVAGRGRANDSLFRELQDADVRVQAVGDCLAPRRMIHAILEGHRAAIAV